MKSGITAFLILYGSLAMAYQFLGRWPQPERTLYFKDISRRGEPLSPSGIPWDEGVLMAMQRWNERAPFTFRHEEHPRWYAGRLDPSCAGPDGWSTVVFRSMNCSSPFQEETLAITLISEQFDPANPSALPTLVDADIIVNANHEWDIFHGPPKGMVMNFVQVVTHELGHLMGLDHEESGVPALLHPTAMSAQLEFPQRDDLLGIQSLYGGEIKQPDICQRVEPLAANVTLEGEFVPEDCRRVDVALSVQDSDDSTVDLYVFDLPESGVPLFVMTSETVDPLLEIRNSTERLATADDFGGTTSAVLFLPLPAGRYLLLANTAPLFAQFGPYRLTFVFARSSDPPSAVLDERDFSIFVPAIEVDGEVYWGRLVPERGNYWRLADYGPTRKPPRAAVFLPDGSLFFSAAEAFGERYDALFRRICPFPECPDDTLYWRLDRHWKC